MIYTLWQDLRQSARALARSRGFALTAILTLAVGIGANTAIFSLVNALLFRPLPFPEPGRLVWITNSHPGGEGIPGMNRRANFRDWRELTHSFHDLAAYVAFSDRMNNTLTGAGEPTRVETVMVTQSFLEVLGVTPRLGRGFRAEECQRNGPRSVILTDRFWRQRFGADPGLVGRSIVINNEPWTVVGILPAAFDFSSCFTPGARAVDYLRPYPDTPGHDNWGNMMAVVGRLKSGVSMGQAQAELDQLNRQLASAHPERGPVGARLVSLREKVSGQFRRAFLVLAGAAACVMLIACANLSNLLLARAMARRKETAVRVALGAGRARLARQMLTESILLSLGGAALGLPLAYMATSALAQSRALSLPLLSTTGVDATALGFALLLALLTGVLFGLLPALQLCRTDVHEGLKEASRGSSHGKQQGWMREALVATEMAMACVLLVGAGLFTRSLVRLLEVDPGFRADQAVAWRIQPNRDFKNHAAEVAFYEELVRRVEALPGVDSTSFAATLPLNLNNIGQVRAKDGPGGPGETRGVFLREVDRRYFHTMRIPFRAGDNFEATATATQTVAVVSQKLASELWPGQEAIGRTLLLDGPPAPPVEFRVAGVAGDVRQSVLEQTAGPEMYLVGSGGRELIVRAKGTVAALTPAVRAALRGLEPNMAVDEFKSLRQMVDQTVSPRRLVTRLVGGFSLLALLLAAIGAYGVIAYSVSQRTQEIGIRLALGSPRQAVLRLVIGRGMRMTVIGGAIGLVVSLALTRVLQSQLFGVSPADPLSFLASGGLLVLVALLACWLPARRAANTDPMVALRNE